MSATPRDRIKEVVVYFLRLGLLGFGGPVVGQMEKELVGHRGWLTKGQMREAIAVLPIAPRPPRNTGRRLRRVSSRRLLGCVGRRMGVHSCEFRDRCRVGGAVRLPWRSKAGDRDLLWGEPSRDRADTAFLLPARKARHGRLVPMADCRRMSCCYLS